MSENSAMKAVQTMQWDQGERIGRMPHTTLYIWKNNNKTLTNKIKVKFDKIMVSNRGANRPEQEEIKRLCAYNKLT